MILIAAHDVGPLRYLQALGTSLNGTLLWLGSSITTPLILKNGSNIFNKYEKKSPNLVLTGSGIVSSMDLNLVIWARKMNLPSISIIEHWSCYRRRFERDGRIILPDYIIVNDEIARKQAILEGLPEGCIYVGGNPRLEELASENISLHDIASWRRKHGLPLGRILIFVAESLGNSFSVGTSNYLGYDEFDVLKAVIEVAPKDVSVVIKRHPEEPDDKYDSLLINNKVFSISEASIAELVSVADFIVGMTSMLLLEIAIFRKNVITFRPNATSEFIGETIGATKAARTKEELKKILNSQKNESIKIDMSHSYRQSFIGSRYRISKFINQVAS